MCRANIQLTETIVEVNAIFHSKYMNKESALSQLFNWVSFNSVRIMHIYEKI